MQRVEKNKTKKKLLLIITQLVWLKRASKRLRMIVHECSLMLRRVFVQKIVSDKKIFFLPKNDFFDQKIFFIQKLFFSSKKYFFLQK